MICFKVLSQYSSEKTEEIHRKSFMIAHSPVKIGITNLLPDKPTVLLLNQLVYPPRRNESKQIFNYKCSLK